MILAADAAKVGVARRRSRVFQQLRERAPANFEAIVKLLQLRDVLAAARRRRA